MNNKPYISIYCSYLYGYLGEDLNATVLANHTSYVFDDLSPYSLCNITIESIGRIGSGPKSHKALHTQQSGRLQHRCNYKHSVCNVCNYSILF